MQKQRDKGNDKVHDFLSLSLTELLSDRVGPRDPQISKNKSFGQPS